MPDVSLSYASQDADIERRMRMAQMLQQQGQAPIDIMRYNGIAAQPSKVGGWAKVLASYLGARGEKKATDERGALAEQDQSSAREALARALGGGAQPQRADPLATAFQGQPQAYQPQTAPPPPNPQDMMRQGLEMSLGGGPASQQAGQVLTQMGSRNYERALTRQGELEQKRTEQAEARAAQEQQVSAIRGTLPPDLPGRDIVERHLAIGDAEGALELLDKMATAKEAGNNVVNAGNGVVFVIGPDGKKVAEYHAPQPGAPAPQGYRWKADGTLEAIGGGPADPKVIRGNRAPPGGGGAAAPSKNPWENYR